MVSSGDDTRVVIADDEPRLRAHVRAALEAGGFDVCGEGSTAAEALELATTHEPHVVLLDIHMPGSGIRAASDISRALPRTAIVMLTQSQADTDLFDSLRAGAIGYLQKGTDPERLPAALRGVLSGEAAIPRSLVAKILGEFRAPARPRLLRHSAQAAKLSVREWEVMELLASGLSTEQVAQRLFVSPTTVRVHVSAVLRKLRVKDCQGAFDALRSP